MKMTGSISCSITVYFNNKAFLGNGHGNCTPIWRLLRHIGLQELKRTARIVTFTDGIVEIDESAIKKYESITNINIKGNRF